MLVVGMETWRGSRPARGTQGGVLAKGGDGYEEGGNMRGVPDLQHQGAA